MSLPDEVNVLRVMEQLYKELRPELNELTYTGVIEITYTESSV